MKYKGKLPQAVVGEIMHVINNKLATVMLTAANLPDKEGKYLENAAMEIAHYIKSFETKEDWNSTPFENESTTSAISSLKKVAAVLAAILLVGCAEDKKSEPAGPTCSTLEGSYYDQPTGTQTLTIAGNCTLTDSVCGYDASYTIPDSAGNTILTVNNTNGTPGCMSNTSHACEIGFNGVQLAISCDGGAHQYLFIKQ